MSENTDPTSGEHAAPAGTNWVPSPGAAPHTPHGSAIPLPPAGAQGAPGVPFPTARAG